MLWHIGNTTIRSPYRLREALSLISASSLQGNLMGRAQEEAFAKQLHEANIVSATRLHQQTKGDVGDLGRKWRFKSQVDEKIESLEKELILLKEVRKEELR